jgi:peptidyl-lysine (3S)-dioxygenase / protease
MKLEPTLGQSVRWSSIRDPTNPPPHTRPITVTVQEGEMLYLPVGWWHYVQQVPDNRGKVIAVNYWYDTEMSGNTWVFLSFLRSLGAPEEAKDSENSYLEAE